MRQFHHTFRHLVVQTSSHRIDVHGRWQAHVVRTTYSFVRSLCAALTELSCSSSSASGSTGSAAWVIHPAPSFGFLSPHDDPHANRGVPIFEPSLEDFIDFAAYMPKIQAWGEVAGAVKIIPPTEWSEDVWSLLPMPLLRGTGKEVKGDPAYKIKVRQFEFGASCSGDPELAQDYSDRTIGSGESRVSFSKWAASCPRGSFPDKPKEGVDRDAKVSPEEAKRIVAGLDRKMKRGETFAYGHNIAGQSISVLVVDIKLPALTLQVP